MSIPFTQYLMPDGRRKEISIDMPANVEHKANRLIKKGYHFDIEMLSTGVISMTCENDSTDEDPCIAIELCENGPEVLSAVEKLIEDATKVMETL